MEEIEKELASAKRIYDNLGVSTNSRYRVSLALADQLAATYRDFTNYVQASKEDIAELEARLAEAQAEIQNLRNVLASIKELYSLETIRALVDKTIPANGEEKP